MEINNLSDFFGDLGRVLVRTVDGLAALLWCLFFLGKALYEVTQTNDPWMVALANLFLIPVILLFVIRLRINKSAQEKFNTGSFISVNVLCFLFLLRG